MKYLLVIGDGMADDPIAELDGRTPLEYARIPYIDALAAKGEVGLVCNCPSGLPPGSDTAILSIFGHDPRRCYTGRSPLEAAASGIALKPGDASYRCNLISLEEKVPYTKKKLLSHSGGSIDGTSSAALAEFLAAQPEFRAAAQEAGITLYPALSFRHIAVQTGAEIAGIQLIPPHDHLGEAIGPLLPSGCPGAQPLARLMELANRLLEHHPINERRRAEGRLPANGIWFWAEGTAAVLESFEAKYHKKGLVISAVPLCHGIARLSGLDVEMVEGATGELDTNYEGKAAAVLRALKGDAYDFAALHLEASDECTHNGDLKGKIQAIEWLDTRAIRPICQELERCGIAFRLLFLSDHRTLTATRGHDAGPVPFLLYDSRKDTGRGLPMTEQSGTQGPFLPDGAASLMPLLLEQKEGE